MIKANNLDKSEKKFLKCASKFPCIMGESFVLLFLT